MVDSRAGACRRNRRIRDQPLRCQPNLQLVCRSRGHGAYRYGWPQRRDHGIERPGQPVRAGGRLPARACAGLESASERRPRPRRGYLSRNGRYQNIVRGDRPRRAARSSRNFARMPSQTRLSSISRPSMFARPHNSADSVERQLQSSKHAISSAEASVARATRKRSQAARKRASVMNSVLAAKQSLLQSLVTQRQSIISDLAQTSVAGPALGQDLRGCRARHAEYNPSRFCMPGLPRSPWRWPWARFWSSCACDAGTELAQPFTPAIEPSAQRLRWLLAATATAASTGRVRPASRRRHCSPGPAT